MSDTQFKLCDDELSGARAAPAGTAPVRRPGARPVFRLPSSSLLLVFLSAATFLLGILIVLYGVSWPVELALAALGVCGAGLAVRIADVERRLNRQLADSESRHHHAQEALADRMWEMQEGEARSRDLVDALGDLVVHRDREGRIVYANRIFADLVGNDAEEIRGRTLHDLKIDVGLAADTAFSDGECLTYNDVSIQTPRSVRWFSWIELSTRDDTTGAVSHRAIARDITVRKNAEAAAIEARERAELANRSKSRFLATVSHEIRTPLNGIMGMATLLADTSLLPEQRTYVAAVSTSANALLVLIEDLLDFSRIEAQRLDLEPQSLAPRELIENIVELLVARAYSKQIGIGCHIANDVPDTIKADPGRLRQVLLNVIGNAVKFTDSGGVLIDVSMNRNISPPSLIFRVEDTGPGLNAADKARIFEEFEQGDGTSTRRHGGTGLGLAISKRIVNAMGGTITVKNRRKTGAEFEIGIPVESDRTAARGSKYALDGRKILIVSPNVMESEALKRSIESHGGTAVLRDSIAAIGKYPGDGAEHFDTAVIDAVLEGEQEPVLEAIGALATRPDRAVIMIAPNDRGRLPQFLEKGYSGFLARPVRGRTLLRVLAAESAKPEIAGAEPTAESECSRSGTSRTLRVLAAEDNEINAMLVTAALEKAGHEVTLVGDGKAAVAAATGGEQDFDVVLMDLHMPVMDGLDAIARIRRHEESEGIDAVPILALTADGQARTRDEVIARGATGFVAKPVDPVILVSSIDKAVLRTVN